MRALSPLRIETVELDERRRVLEGLAVGLGECAAMGEGLVAAALLSAPERAGGAAALNDRLRLLEADTAALREALGAAAEGYERAEEEAGSGIPALLAPEAAVTVFGRRVGESLARRLPGAVEDAAVLVRAVADAAFGSASAAVRALAGEESAEADLAQEGEDLVRALGGLGRTAGEEPGVVLVERDSAEGTPRDSLVPAHALDAYVATARALDAAADPRVAAAGAALFPLWRGAPDARTAARLTTVPVSPGGGRERRGAGAAR